jgi:transposase-like protein
MPKGFPSLTQEQKQEIISRIKDKGERVAELAKEYGVVPKTIYNLLSRSTESSGTMLELSRLKREHEALLKIIGELVTDQRLGKKIQRRYGN